MSEISEIQNWNPAYIGERTDILGLIHGTPESVLDVGCATGANGKWIKKRFSSKVVGLEFDPSMREVASKIYDMVHRIDLNIELPGNVIKDQLFDLIICGDILEHLNNPWKVLSNLKMVLKPGGYILISLPNINHFSVLCSLFFLGEWKYNNRGIMDKTHLRFFTKKSISKLYADCGLKIKQEKRNLRIIESGSPLNKLAFIFDFFPLRRFFVFQYLHRVVSKE